MREFIIVVLGFFLLAFYNQVTILETQLAEVQASEQKLDKQLDMAVGELMQCRGILANNNLLPLVTND